MKKILAIATVALLSTIATAAHADVVNFPGSVASSCTLAVTDGQLTAATTAVTQIDSATGAGSTPANANVVCNGGSKLDVVVNPGASTTYGATPTAYFLGSGGDGIYTTIPNASANSFTSTSSTSANGDNAKIGAKIKSGSGALLPVATDYKVVADVTLTAQ